MTYLRKFIILFLTVAFTLSSQLTNAQDTTRVKRDMGPIIHGQAKGFLMQYNKRYQELYKEAAEAEWKLNTYIKEGDDAKKILSDEANKKLAEFTGSEIVISACKHFLNNRQHLDSLQLKQINAIMYMAGANPATAGDLIEEKISAESKQTSDLFGFDYRLNGQSVSTNDIDKVLKNSEDLNERLAAWKASKEVGKNLKDGLADLKRLRNKTVQSLDYDDYFQYQVSEYGMTSEEMVALCDQLVKEVWPLYRELHTWARYELASKYSQDVPETLPAHWLPNRWGQDWSPMVDVKGLNIDAFLEEKGAEYIVKQGEEFYVSLGFDTLPPTFYSLSSLYPLPADADYKKNNHASAWHMDLDTDVRSLMSVEPNTEWWGTVLHELGHIYYYISYSTPEVPIVLRGGANRGYHEAMGSLIGLASLQKPFLQERGMVNKKTKVDEIQSMLREALDFIVHIPWGAGVMTHFEHELYSKDLSKDEFNKKWWELVRKYQGISPPDQRGEEYCDAATKTHINNDAAQYYDYSISNVLLFMFHDHISKEILRQDPHATNYWGSKETGKFLKSLMETGATMDWRQHLQQYLGKDMTAQPMLDYFEPLMQHLKKENEGRKYTLSETPGS
jgi:peptidyl-dipeptidase A